MKSGVKVIGAILLLLLGIVAFPFLIINFGLLFLPSPPKPKAQYGEFPFCLEYAINGRNIVVEDTLICKYAGIGVNSGVGKYRKWEGRLKSGKNAIVLLNVDNNTTLSFLIGESEYYMGDMGPGVTFDIDAHSAVLDKLSENGLHSSLVTEEDLLKYYKIQIIRWEHSAPIKMTF